MDQACAKWAQLPDGLKAFNQWCVAGEDKAPFLPGNNGLYRAKVTEGPWLSFEDACYWAQQYGAGIGFVFTEQDPYTCIDLDVKDAASVNKKTGEPLPKEEWTTPQELAKYESITTLANSYTELSRSGKGQHIIVQGATDGGRNYGGIEVYSSERFVVCTGVPVHGVRYQTINDYTIALIGTNDALPVAERQNLIDTLVAEGDQKRAMEKNARNYELVEHEPTHSDQDVWAMAAGADNADKFIALCEGRWQELGYPSQSEADLSLMSMFTFYSRSNSQCVRMFRQTALGQREKATKDDRYTNLTLRIVRSRQEREDAVAERAVADTRAVIAQMQSEHAAEVVEQAREEAQIPEVEGLQWPPGFVGALAAFFYNSAPRPVKEVAIVAALGFMAGVAGKAYNINRSGLNIYMILIARSAVGKEAMHGGIGLLLSQLGDEIPGFDKFIDYNQFASGPALIKACADHSSFINIAGEWGRKLKRLSIEDGRDGPMQQLRTVMTDLYQKSGIGSVAGGLSYSNKDQNISSSGAVAYSMIGESTPGTFFDSLTETMMEDGFLSRFNIIEYQGDRPPLNPNPITKVPHAIASNISAIVGTAWGLLRDGPYHVRLTEEAQAYLDDFDLECDEQINSTTDESWRQMWNRAHLKALRISALLAVGDDFGEPCITLEQAEWALDLIRRDIAIMTQRIEDGDVGVGDSSRERKMLSIIREYAKGKVKDSYGVDKELMSEGIVTRSYLMTRARQVNSFTSHKLGLTAALDMTIKSLMDSGFLEEVPKTQVIAKHGFRGRCFRIVNIPNAAK